MTNCRLQLFEIVDNFQKKILSKNKVTSILFQFFIDLALSEGVLSHAKVFFLISYPYHDHNGFYKSNYKHEE